MANVNDDTPPQYSEGDRVRVNIPKPDKDDYNTPEERVEYRLARYDHEQFDGRTGTVTYVLNSFQYEVKFDDGTNPADEPHFGVNFLEGDLEALDEE